MQVSAATGMLSAGSAGVLDSKACVVKGNCSGLVADIAIAAVASRLPALGTARSSTRLSGQAIFGGRDTAVKNMIRYSERYPMDGYYDVIGHGLPDSVVGMSASELAKKIGPATQGQNVRLLSCLTACESGTFAQDLADELGVTVLAPTTEISASGKGKTLTIYDGGEWRWFNPTNRR
jgi:hypothetical protein